MRDRIVFFMLFEFILFFYIPGKLYLIFKQIKKNSTTSFKDKSKKQYPKALM